MPVYEMYEWNEYFIMQEEAREAEKRNNDRQRKQKNNRPKAPKGAKKPRVSGEPR